MKLFKLLAFRLINVDGYEYSNPNNNFLKMKTHSKSAFTNRRRLLARSARSAPAFDGARLDSKL